MASALSEDEFHRMQLQLLELRTTNYELEGKCKKLERELGESTSKTESLDKELTKANKAINKSKKAKETELLLQDNDSLQRKLISQEEEFRLQNQTLMTELSMLVASNEELEKKVQELQAGGAQEGSRGTSAAAEKGSEVEDQVRHLQAQNAALQKNLTAAQDKYEKELSNLREALKLKSEDQEKGRQSPAGSEDVSEEKREVEGQADNDPQTTAVNASVAQSQRKVEELIEKMNDLQLKLDTEGEEKQLLKEQLKKSKEQVGVLEEEREKLGEKLKKKQESFLQLQSEKETLFEDSKKKAEELQGARDRDQKYYQDQINKLQQELEKAKQVQESLKTSSEGQAQELQQKLNELQKQVDAASLVGNHQLQEQSNKYQQEIKELSSQLLSLRQRNDDLSVQLQASQRASEETVSQLQAAQQERDGQITALQEASRVAEKRKALLDELAIKYQKEYDAHREHTLAAEERHRGEVKGLQDEIVALESRVKELSKAQPLIEEMQGKVRSLEDAKGWLERRLKETEEQLAVSRRELSETKEALVEQHSTEVREMREQHLTELLHLKENHDLQLKEWEEKESQMQEEMSKLKMTISSLNQNIQDGVGEKKIHEKKGMSMLKDLKRQLHSERKRAEKLQERLQEVLSESKNKSMEELFRPADPGDLMHCDGSSVSSWSAGASGLGKDSVASGPQSPTTPNTGNHSFSSLTSESGDDYAELLKRLTSMQEQKWALEEKVNHLETSNACMAEDLLQKTAIIEHYVMNTHSAGGRRQPQQQGSGGGGGGGEDKLATLRKVVELVKSGDHGELHEMNRKLQLMLEETLTKNMHLQQDLETMSQELVRLSKLPVQNVANATEADIRLQSPGSTGSQASPVSCGDEEAGPHHSPASSAAEEKGQSRDNSTAASSAGGAGDGGEET
ncbi:GRIP1-associated protein 1-like [Babylonia areolata]|uniref:GRIP1-associated protein 1-like n=1 Tax=Babylonia areolata TaxID=304850 RepID=UPI003FD2EFC1